MRLLASEPLIGKGLMTTDSAHWARSRTVLQPLFSRTQSTNYFTLETHVARFIDLIPKDGSTTDLQPLFAELALDSSSEFLFVESLELPLATPSSSAQIF